VPNVRRSSRRGMKDFGGLSIIFLTNYFRFRGGILPPRKRQYAVSAMSKNFVDSPLRRVVWQCLTDGSPVTDFPFKTPAEAVYSYLEIA
jgi:hypothetical protein